MSMYGLGLSAVCEQSTLVLPTFFFFQAEDGIRDSSVTGVQTCALPIFLKLDADSEIALQGLGAAGLAAEEFAEAAKCYERLVELHPANYDYWLNLGVARHRLGRHESAAESYQKALQIRPEGRSAYMNLG